NGRKIVLSPLDQDGILELTKAHFNGYNEGFDTDMLLERSGIHIGDNHFDVLAVSNELCFGESVQSSRTNEKFTSDDFTFHQGFIDGLGLTLDENHVVNQIIYLHYK